MDQGHIYSALIQDKGGVKSLIGADIFSATKAKLDPKRNPTGFSVAIGKAYEQLTSKLEKKDLKYLKGLSKVFIQEHPFLLQLIIHLVY